jgi:hypothetical protein
MRKLSGEIVKRVQFSWSLLGSENHKCKKSPDFFGDQTKLFIVHFHVVSLFLGYFMSVENINLSV